MKLTDVYPSKYLKSSDVPEGGLVVTIADVSVENFKTRDGDDEQKPVAIFSDHDKQLILNRTNWNTIADQLGEDSDTWIGGKIKLIVLHVQAFGETVEAIRIAQRRKAPPLTRPAAKPAPVVAEPPCPEDPPDAWDVEAAA